jgi:hypothetical protein
MKATNAILIGLSAFIAVKLFGKTRAADKLDFFPKKVSLRLEFLTPVLDFIVGIQNPTNQDFTVSSIVGQLFINKSFVANVSGYQHTVIRSLSEAEFPISARLSLSGASAEISTIINSITTAGLSTLRNATATFKGTVTAEGFTIPLQFTYKLP